MSAEYTMQEIKDLNEEGKTLLYPRMVIRRQVSTDEIVEGMTENTTFAPSEAKGIVQEFVRGIARAMASGCSVKIDGLGLFTPSLGLAKGKAREQADGSGTRRNASSIEITGANFRADKEFIWEMRDHCTLKRAKEQFRMKTSKYTEEERFARAKEYLARRHSMSISTYATLVGLSKSTAGKELRRWADEPGRGMTTVGLGTHKRYVLKE